MSDIKLPMGGTSAASASADQASLVAGPGGLCEAFIAGMLHHLPALVLWTLPSPLSAARVQPSTWSGAFR